jgi:hypothetical protein
MNRKRMMWAVGALSAITSVVCMLRPERNLLAVSRRVCGITGAPDGSPAIDAELAARIATSGFMPYYFFNEYFGNDRHTGHPKFMPNAVDVSAPGLRGRVGWASPVSMSPDRRWLLASFTNFDDHVEEWFAVRADGTDVHQWIRPGSSSWFWSPDSAGGLLFDHDSDEVETWSLATPSGKLRNARRRRQYSPFGWSPFGANRDGVLAFWMSNSLGGPVRIALIAPHRRLREIGSFQAPRGGECVEAALSPDGEWVAMLIRYDVEPPRSPLLRGMYTALHYPTGSFDSIWLCRPDGRGLHEAGRMRTTVPSNGKYISQFGWLQDEKHLWFEYEQSIRLMEVDCG